MVKEFYSKSSRDVDSRWAEDALMKDEVCRPFYTFSDRQMVQMPQNCGKLTICRLFGTISLSYFFFVHSIGKNGKWAICHYFAANEPFAALLLYKIDDLPTLPILYWDNFSPTFFALTFTWQKRQMVHLPSLCGKWSICRVFVIQNERFADFADFWIKL